MAAGLPTSWTYEIEFTAGVWTNFASLTGAAPIVIRVGRSDASSDAQPGVCTAVLDNFDGSLTPDNPLSAYYPNLTEGKRIRVVVTKGSSSTRFLGRITSITPDYPTEPSNCKTTITAVDLLGDLANITLASTLQQSYLNDPGLKDYFTLGEPSGATLANSSMSAPKTPYLTPSDAGVAFGQGTGPSDGLTATTIGAGSSLSGTPAGSPIGNEFHMWFSLPSGAPATDLLTVWFSSAPGSYGGYAKVSTSAAGYIRFTRVLADGTVLSAGSVDLGNVVANNSVHLMILQEANVFGTLTPGVYIDSGGLLAGSTIAAINDSPYTKVRIGGTNPVTVSHFAVSTSAGAQLIAVLRAGSLGVLGATLDSQAVDLSTSTGITCAYSATSAKGAASLYGQQGKTALDVLIILANGEGGIAYHDYASNTVVMPLRSTLRASTVALTIDGEADQDGGPQLSRSNVQKISSVTATSGAFSATASDATLIAQLGTSNDTVEATVANVNDLYSIASNRIGIGRDQKLRISQVTADLVTAQNDLYSAMFAMTPGKRVRLSNLPSTHLGFTYMDGYVEGWTEEIGTEVYRVTFDLSPADSPSELPYDTGRYCWGDGVATAAVATSSATSMVVTWASAVTLSTVAGDYPMDLNWNGERVTVTSAPAGGTSPQTLTITRGVAPSVARAHAAGETVDVWDADRFAF